MGQRDDSDSRKKEQPLRTKLISRENTSGEHLVDQPDAILRLRDDYWAAAAPCLAQLYSYVAAKRKAVEDESEVVMDALEKGWFFIEEQYVSGKSKFCFDPHGEMPFGIWLTVIIGTGQGGKTKAERAKGGVLGTHVRKVGRRKDVVLSQLAAADTDESQDEVLSRIAGSSVADQRQCAVNQDKLSAVYTYLPKLPVDHRLAIVAIIVDELVDFGAPDREAILTKVCNLFPVARRPKTKMILRNALKAARDGDRSMDEIIAPYIQVTSETVRAWQKAFLALARKNGFGPDKPRHAA